MSAIPKAPRVMPTLVAMYAAIESAQDSNPRPYLGASQLGHPCARHLFYSFRWAAKRVIPASSLLAIQDGFAGEDVMTGRLRMVPGLTLHTVDPHTGNQFAIDGVAGHMRGHLDGAVVGVVEAPKTWHVWEHKQVNLDKFRKLAKLVDQLGEKAALEQWDEVYFLQAQIYMGATGMHRHFLTVGAPGGRDYITVRTEFAKPAFDAMLAKAEKVVSASEPPLRLSDDPEYFQCKWCAYAAVCHAGATPEVNCRTCLHSTPDLAGAGGVWRCEKHASNINTEQQREGCAGHLFIPPLLRALGEPVDADDESVTYKTPAGTTFANGFRPGFASVEIYRLKDKRALTDPTVLEALATFKTAEVIA